MRRGRNSTPQKTKRAQSKERRREPSYTIVRAHPIAKDAKRWGTLKIIRFVALCGVPRITARNRRATKPELGGVVEWRFKITSKKAALSRPYGESCGWDGGISNY